MRKVELAEGEILVSIHSTDQTPHLGCGWRIVAARDTRGGKRVLLRNPHTGGQQSVTTQTYDAIVLDEYDV